MHIVGFAFLVAVGWLLFKNEGVFVGLYLVGLVDRADHRFGGVEELEEILLWFWSLLLFNVVT